MKFSFITFVVYWFLRFVVSLRYRVHVFGLKEVAQHIAKDKGLLILPNHVAEIDPVILFTLMWRDLRPRPVVIEDFYYLQGIQLFLKAVKALPCPNMEQTVNRWKMKRLKKLQEQIVKGLKEGEKFLIYPSGKLKSTYEEVLGGASFVPSILLEARSQATPPSIVLVRTEGLWGSRFSKGLTGETPPFGSKLIEGMKVLLKNFLFFTPKRDVSITFELASPVFSELSDRQSMNRYLETWYNKTSEGKGDRLILVPDYFWSKKLPKIRMEQKSKFTAPDLNALSDETKKEIIDKVADLASLAPERVQPGHALIRDLGLDSLDIAQLTVFLDERFHVKDVCPLDLETVGDLFFCALQPPSKEISPHLDELHKLPKEKNRPCVIAPQGSTIQEAFLRSCDRMGGSMACIDALSGVMTYRKFKMAALILASKIRELPGENIGILLPSSVGACLLVLAVQLAKKTPVMLNWTTGVKSLDHAAEVTKIETVLSSLKFLTRIKDLELGVIEEKIILLEDIRRELGLKDKIEGLIKSRGSAKKLIKQLGLDTIKPDDTAVILFTSGTETLPKGVPLSHFNLLSNQTAAIQVTQFSQNELLYAVLPPFHSFGFSVTGLLPLLTGLKVAYAPDPTDGYAMARDIAGYHATFFICAPSFIKGLFKAADRSQLKSLRLVVSGAEKASEELFDYVESLGKGAQLIEGYGITECSPIVTLNRPGAKNIGVGRPLEGIELCIIDPESGELLPNDRQGEVCIHGPNVFKGYLGIVKDPFILLQGKRWYRSGDLGTITPDGSLLLSGRLKRFVKIGGEMVSLGGLEEEILEIIKEKSLDRLPSGVTEVKGPPIALCAKERPGEKTHLILASVYEVEKEAINIALKHRGHSNLVRLNEIRYFKEIPLTGTGKTHYRSLEQSLL